MAARDARHAGGDKIGSQNYNDAIAVDGWKDPTVIPPTVDPNDANAVDAWKESDEAANFIGRKDKITSPPPPLQPPPLEGGWGWACVAGCSLMHLISAGLGKSYGVIIVGIISQFQCSSSQAAWIGGATVGLRLLLSPVVTSLLQRYSCRQLTMAGALFCAAGAALSATVDSWQSFLITYGIIHGIGAALTYTPSLVILSHYFDRRKALAFGLGVSGVGIGTLAFPPLVQFLLEEYHYAYTFLYIGAINAHLCVSAVLYRPFKDNFTICERKGLEDGSVKMSVPSAQNDAGTTYEYDNPTPTADSRRPNEETAADPSHTSFRERIRALIDITLLINARFSLIIVIQSTFLIAVICTITFLIPLAIEKGVSKPDAAFLMSINGVADLVGRIAFGAILNLSVAKNMTVQTHLLSMLGFTLVNLLTGLSCSSLASLIVASTLNGLLSGGMMTVIIVEVQEIFGRDNYAHVISYLMFFLGFVITGGGPLAGWLADVAGSYAVVFSFAAALNLVGSVALGILLYLSLRRQSSESY